MAKGYARFENVFKNELRKGEVKERYIEEYSKEHNYLMTLINIFHNSVLDKYVFNLNNLYEFGGINKSAMKIEFDDVFRDLIEWGIITTDYNTKKINRNDLIMVNIPEYEEGFTTISNGLIMKVLNSDERVNKKMNLTFLLVAIESYSNNKDKYSYPSVKSLRKAIGVSSDTTVSSNLETLRDLGTIEYGNVGNVVVRGELRNSGNIYILCDKNDYMGILNNALKDRAKTLSLKYYSIEEQKSNREKIKEIRSKKAKNEIDEEYLKVLENREEEIKQEQEFIDNHNNSIISKKSTDTTRDVLGVVGGDSDVNDIERQLGEDREFLRSIGALELDLETDLELDIDMFDLPDF